MACCCFCCNDQPSADRWRHTCGPWVAQSGSWEITLTVGCTQDHGSDLRQSTARHSPFPTVNGKWRCRFTHVVEHFSRNHRTGQHLDRHFVVWLMIRSTTPTAIVVIVTVDTVRWMPSLVAHGVAVPGGERFMMRSTFGVVVASNRSPSIQFNPNSVVLNDDLTDTRTD